MLAFHFNCVPRKVKEMGFHFGNLSSRYGANNLYFTKDGRPFLPIAGELHFSRLPREGIRVPYTLHAAGDVGAGAAQDEGYGDHGCFHLCFLELP